LILVAAGALAGAEFVGRASQERRALLRRILPFT
jgi:hypothetical protein